MMFLSHFSSVFLMSVVLFVVSVVVSYKCLDSRNKISPFECGFDPKDSGRLPFSLRFFLLAVIFLIFDIEVVLLMPLIMGVKVFVSSVSAAFIFSVILIGGLFHEWRLGSLSWVN